MKFFKNIFIVVLVMSYQADSSPIKQNGNEAEIHNGIEVKTSETPMKVQIKMSEVQEMLGAAENRIKQLHRQMFQTFQKKAQQYDKFRKVKDLFYFVTDKNSLPLF